VYSGTIGSYPIEFAIGRIQAEDSQTINGVYMYIQYHEPITLQGTLVRNRMELIEYDKQNKKTAMLSFDNYNQDRDTISGPWKNYATSKKNEIILQRNCNFDKNLSDSVLNEVGLLQQTSLNHFYFKIFLSNPKDCESNSRGCVTRINVLRKIDGKIYQQLKLESDAFGIAAIEKGDYNFDGITDISMFKTCGAHGECFWFYFLWDPNSKLFFDSKYELCQAKFDTGKKLIYENCIYTKSVYKVVNNCLKVVRQTCYDFSPSDSDLVVVPCRK
jgi:hypothetical protein